MSANENESAVSNLSTTDEVSRSSVNESQADGTLHGSPLTETASLTAGADSSRYYIKRPLNAYMIWTRHARDGILKANPHLKMNEVSKTMGEMWKKLPEEEKKPFFVIARKSAMKHKKALEKNPNLAYVPSKKKVKKGKKPPDEPVPKDEASGGKANQPQRTSTSPYPTPSASPHTPSTRAGFVHPAQTPSTQPPPAETNRPPPASSSAFSPPAAIIRPANSTAFSTPTHGTAHVPPYQPDYRTPAGVSHPVVAAQPVYSYAQPTTPQIRYVASAPSGQPAQPSFADPAALHANQHMVYANPPFHAPLPEPPAHFIPNPREQGAYLVRNPYAFPRTDLAEPVYEPETPDVYKELYYRSLVQLQLPAKYGQAEREVLTPEFYLQRYYALGGSDPPAPSPAKTATNNTNGLVYQEL
ncbi:HMG box domain-containing protein [Aphelenchoides fujianensis]|nr:HMG box domain-containing protein [Aphelenchoides fujianensis]